MDDYQAYRETTFEADTPVGRAEVRVGEPSRKLDQLLEFEGVKAWAFLTAWNPGGTFAGEEQNRRRQKRLVEELRGEDYPMFAGERVPDNADWAPEECVLVLDVSEEEAREWADQFDQSNVVVGGLREPTRLIDVDSGQDVTEYAERQTDEEAEAELDDVLGDLGGTVGESVDSLRSQPPPNMQEAVDWEMVIRVMEYGEDIWDEDDD